MGKGGAERRKRISKKRKLKGAITANIYCPERTINSLADSHHTLTLDLSDRYSISLYIIL